MIDLYQILNIEYNSTKETILLAYHKQKQRYANMSNEWLIDEAYFVLSNDDKRHKYNLVFLAHQQKHSPIANIDNVIANTVNIAAKQKIPILLRIIMVLIAINCGFGILGGVTNVCKFALLGNNSVDITSRFIAGFFGILASSVPVLISLWGIKKRVRVAIFALLIVEVLHIFGNLVHGYIFGNAIATVVDVSHLVLCIILMVCALNSPNCKK